VFSEPKVYTFWRGRVALYGILKSLNIGHGDAVLLPGYTCFAVPSAVQFTGAQPLYADINPETFNVSLSTIRARLGDHPKANVKAILVQHTYGIPADSTSIVAWARQRGIAVIEDCAHALGCRYRNEGGEWCEVGSAGDAAFFSSQWTKPVSTGLGGWARVENPRLEPLLHRFHEEECSAPSLGQVVLLAAQVLAQKMFLPSWAYWKAKTGYRWLSMHGLVIGTSTEEELRGDMPAAYAKRMSGFQRWLLKKSLTDAAVQAHRRILKSIYDATIESVGLNAPKTPDYADPVLLRYPVRVCDKQRVLELAQRRGVELGDWYTDPVDRPESLKGKTFGYQTGMCPEGERAAREVINLPMHLGVTQRAAHRALELLKEVS
jgi:dTDP-4-amino-4,6-dideoxygalactose transaminase